MSLVTSGGTTFVFVNTPGGTMTIATNGQVNGADVLVHDTHGFYMIGDDTIIEGGGDALWGGAGADVFKYTAASDSSAGGNDSIFDFQSGVDKLDLTGVRTGASDVYGLLSSGGSTFVFIDLGGNGVGDMTLQLTNTASVVAADILF